MIFRLRHGFLERLAYALAHILSGLFALVTCLQLGISLNLAVAKWTTLRNMK